MQTQCPHCDTRFRVTESQVNTADGFVRCSVCKEVFNAIEVAEQDEHQPSLLNPEQRQETYQEQSQDDSSEETYGKNFAANDYEILEDTPPPKEIDFSETSATDDLRKDTFDFFDEAENESLSHVVPEQYKSPYTEESSTTSNILWGLGTLLLIATLFIEYTWFNRDQLIQNPTLQNWADKLCQQVECKNIAMRDPTKIELISRNVYSHPNRKKALMINLTMKNHADFAQPFPVMQIKFSDVRGGNVAARRFLPAEYLPAEFQQQLATQLLEPDTNMTFTMEIQDPGKQALTYEFDFL